MAWIRTIDKSQAEGELLEVYQAMASRPIPSAYIPPHGGSPGIHLAHSLDASLVRHVFRTTGTLHAGDKLSWAERELASSVAARIAGCFY
ncbi:MAG: hypothetical protein QM820_42420 [Minicystis sp.]